MNFDDAKRIAQALGFSRIADIRGNLNTQKIFSSQEDDDEKKPLVGIYLQIRHDNSIYIGKTENLTRRTSAHRDAGTLVAFLAFRPLKKGQLKSAEERTILKARMLNFPLANISSNREALGKEEMHFDDFMSIDSQDNFIKNVIEGNTYAGRWRAAYIRASQQDRWEWDRFIRATDRSNAQLIAARTYITTAIPKYQECFGNYLRCTLPLPGRNSLVKTLTLIAGMTGVFEIVYYLQTKKQLYANIMLDPGTLYEAYKTKEAIETTFAWAKFELPKPEPERSIDELMTLGTKHTHHMIFRSPMEKKAYLSRRLTHVNVKNLALMTVPIDAVDSTLAHPVIATAAALAAVASMRYSNPVGVDNNELLMLKICPEVLD